ncbi:MAG: hypothetical protein KC593_19620 [Myxococcales bacterium]|nr:hypothetical protein [Myxococcales bacterium]
MFRACLVGFACWVAAGAFGLLDVSSAAAVAARSEWDGSVTAPAEHDTHVTESRALTWSAVTDRPATGAGSTSARRVALLMGCALWHLGAHQPSLGDARVASRTRAVARRSVDLRREVFRIRPGHRGGSADPAPELFV